jgi:Domain of Unknown Function (DUF349)
MTEQPWGRVDDRGQVFVRTADGERKVGEWLAGEPADGLAYYTRRYEALAVEIDLLSHRIGEAGLSPEESMAKIGKIRSQLDEPTCVGDLAALRSRLDGLVAVVDGKRAERAAEKEAARAGTLARREALVAEAETLAEGNRWKAGSERFRAIVEEWKSLPRHDRATEQALWQRISHARSRFDKRRRTHFAELDSQRQVAEATKEKLVAEAETLSTSTDWGATSAAYRDLMSRWKAAGPAPRGAEDALWQRFRAAQDTFFAARNATFAERDAGQLENLAAKQALATEAEAILPVDDPAEARRRLRSIQDRWAAIGHVPRHEREAVEGRLRAVEQAVREAEETRWRRSNPEGRARAADTVAQLTASIDKLERQRQAALDAGNAGKAAEAEAALEARRQWLVQAEQALAEFGG